jgi:tetratricopeptide (TPR) repeat protein
MNFSSRKISMGLSKWMAVVLFANCVSVWAQTPHTSPPLAIGEPSQSSHPDHANPDFVEVHRLLQQGKFDEGISQLQAAAARNPGLKGLSREFGAAYYQKGDYVKGIDSLKQALAEDPENKEATQLLGLSYYLPEGPRRPSLPC